MDTLVKKLRDVLKPEQVIHEAEELLVYECDGLPHYRARPRAVVFPASTEEVAAVLRVLASERVALVPRGAGTGLSGGALCDGGVCIELARMRRVLKVDVENRLALVEAGLVNAQLSRAVARHGLHYAPDPSSQASCTIGGNIAENAGGIHCLKYGTTTDHVLGARVVLSDGQIVDLGGAGAQASGYDLLGVFVGSEGTFGVVTEATVRLTPVAPSVRTLLADFTDIDAASRAVSAIIAAGVIPAALEMVDNATIRAVEASVFAAGMPLDAEAALLVELDGLEAGLDTEVERVRSICRESGAREVKLAADELERKRLWAARKGAFGAMGRLAPDVMIQDAVVPRSRLPEVLAALVRIGAKYRLRLANVFHAGDGNLHPFISFDSRDTDEARRVAEAGREMMQTCVRAGGTITGEHGVGMDKRDYLPLIFNEDDMRAMLGVRAAFDPSGLCNPGKIIPVLKGCGEARAVLAGGDSAGDGARRAAVGGEGQASQADGNGRGVKDTESVLAGISSQAVRVSQTPVQPSGGGTVGRLDREGVLRGLLASVVGDGHVAFDDAARGRIYVSPASTEEACEVLKIASVVGWGVMPAGACSWLDAGNPARGPLVVVKTARMACVVEHEPADLVATAEAGVRLADFNREVGRAGQWLPLDSPDDGSVTLGGVAATGMGGAQAFGYGQPRAHVLGMRVALSDGKLVRAGGRVVKNVAGYDLCKLFVGSYGTLGLILELTLKLRPRPAREATLLARSTDWRALHGAARAVVSAQLLPVAVELLSRGMAASLDLPCGPGDAALLVRFAGTDETVAYQLERAREIVSGHGGGVEALTDDPACWSKLSAAALRDDGGVIWRAGVLPSELGSMLSEIEARGGQEWKWHAGAGDGRVRVFEAEGETATLSSLRQAARRAGGSLVVERAPSELKREFDAWGLTDSTAALMRRVKEQLDPAGLFAPDRFRFND